MTREDIEQLNVVEPYCFESDREELWYNIGLKDGLEIADNNPKSPWISVNDDLPCNYEELLLDNGLATNIVFVLINATTPALCSMAKFSKWDWILSNVTHWMPIPELPKE